MVDWIVDKEGVVRKAVSVAERFKKAGTHLLGELGFAELMRKKQAEDQAKKKPPSPKAGG